jgi:uncharacterized phiE125 gp8 family phage protein
MNINVTVQPTTEPITTTEAKEELRIESAVTDYDDLIARLIKAARQFAEEYLGIGLMTQTVVQKWDEFPDINRFNKYGGLYLGYGNIQSVNWLKYIDSDGVERELTGTTKATGTYTFSGVPTNTQTTTINSTVYTWQTTLTNTAGNVLIGADATENARNLTAAINLGTGAGVYYAADTVVNPDVTATYLAGVVTVTAILATTAPNSYATTDTADNAVWTAATLTGGTGDGIDYKTDITSYQPKIVPAYGATWPAVRDEVNAVSAEYIRGWTTASLVPEPLKQAMKQMIVSWFECPEDKVKRLPTSSQHLMDLWKIQCL